MKKTGAISFLLIANLILLAHAFIPHHHQDNIPSCALEIISHDDFELYGHDSSSCTHHKHAQTRESSHDLDYLSSIPLRLEKERRAVCGHLHTMLDHCPVLISTLFEPFIPQECALPQRYKPPVSSHHTVFVAQSLGLRGPPFA